MELPPLAELQYAANRIAGIDALAAMEVVPYSWLLRWRTLLWYLEGLGATPRFRSIKEAIKINRVEALMG